MVQKTTTSQTFITPQAALIALLVYSTLIAISTHLYVPMLLPIIFLGFIYKTQWKNILKKLLFINTLVLIVVVTLLLQSEYALAQLMFCRSNLILLAVLLLFCDKDEFSIAIAMNGLHFPAKLTSMMFFTAKSIFLIKHEFERFKNTLKIRGFALKTNLLSYQTLAGFVGILVIKALERSQALQKAMHLRGFCGKVYSLEAHHPFTLYDAILCASVLCACIIQKGMFL